MRVRMASLSDGLAEWVEAQEEEEEEVVVVVVGATMHASVHRLAI